MKLYSSKQKWKLILSISGLVIVILIFFVTSFIVSNVKKAERQKIKLWSQSIQKKAALVKLTNQSFSALEQKEKEKIKLWAEATRELGKEREDYGLAMSIIKSNIKSDLDSTSPSDKIPVILTNDKKEIISYENLPVLDKIKDKKILIDSLINNWKEINKPIEIKYLQGKSQIVYYSYSQSFYNLQNRRDSLIESFNTDLIKNAALVPVVFIDSKTAEVKETNIKTNDLEKAISRMKLENEPIKIDLGSGNNGIVYYNNSNTLIQLKYFPFFILIVIAIFLLISYILFSMFRRAEQNQVWAGMAKETAHQLGTPLSSLQGWIEILKEKSFHDIEPFIEMEKDVKRLTIVSERFSKIGSKVKLSEHEINDFVKSYLTYMKKRLPKTVNVVLDFSNEKEMAKINPPLFSWVIENVLKNSADAMGGIGRINVLISNKNNQISIEISDEGRGVPITKFKTIFEPGYTSKERGWGLGLSLAKRIIEGHHNGKIHIKTSKIDVGTTIEILLPANN